MRVLVLCWMLGLCLWCTRLGAAEGVFSAAPVLEKADGSTKITFALAGKSDVEVAVLNARDEPVRHLAAGVLGGVKTPPEPLQPGLKQTLVWDGKDDLGKLAEGGPFKVRIRTGLRVAFGRTLSDSPYHINTVCGVAGDADGNLYILHQAYDKGPETVQVFDAGGKYVRTVFPAPGNLPRERLGDLFYWDEEAGRSIPRNYNDIYPRFVPYQVKAGESLGMVPVVGKESGVLLHAPQWLFRLDPDGSTGGRPLRFGFLFPHGISSYDAASSEIFTTATPDGKTIFGCGPYAKSDAAGKPFAPFWPAGQIFRMPLGAQEYLKPWARLAPPEGKGAGGPVLAGMAADAQSRLYVCDRAGGRVVVLDADGKQIGAVPVADPLRVQVHPVDGSVYVLTARMLQRQRHAYTLLRFAGLEAKEPAARLDLGEHKFGRAWLQVSVKDGATGVWVVALDGNVNRLDRADATRYEEKAGTFAATVKLHEHDPDSLGKHDTIAVDPETEDVYINDDYSGMYRYNGLTGTGGPLRKVRGDFSATEAAFGRDGLLYARTGPSYSGPFERLTRDLKPAALASGTHFLTEYVYSRYGAGHAEKGIAIGPRGEAYVMNMYDWQRYAIYGLTPEGKFMDGGYLKGKLKAYDGRKENRPESAVIGPVPDTCGGLRVDSKGRIYVGMLLLPPDWKGPAVLARDASWRSLVGSILRFSPAGGEWICTDPELARRGPAELKRAIPPGAQGIQLENGHFMLGADAVYPELAPFSGSAGTSETGRPPLGRENCACRSPRFDLDRFDRLYVPNAVTGRVRVFDNAGNEILAFGDYGNQDSAGPGSPVPGPAIPLAWPIGVAVSARHVYVADQMNRRIVRVDKSFASEVVLPLE